MDRAAILSVILLLAAPAATAAIPQLPEVGAGACSVPCGRIYPLILLQVEDQPDTYPLAAGGSFSVDALLTYKFDMTNEGYTVATPNEPIVIRFEYPRLPDWAQLSVEPDAISVDVANPLYVQPNTAEPTNPQAQYVFTTPITIHASLVGRPVLKDGYDFAKLLVFAKSTESGLYQSGYGIKELRVVPEGAVHESDVAGERDVFTPVPLPAISLAPVERAFGGTTVTLTPPATPAFWQPSEFVATVSPAPSGRMLFAVHDETGALVAASPSLDAATGEARLNVTLAKPGRHAASLTLLPDAGSSTPPITYALPFDTGPLDAEGYHYPKSYVVSTSEPVPAPLVASADPLAQFERDIPFFAFDTAQSVSASVTLKSSALPVDLGRSGANLQFSIHDPDGNMLQAGSVDPTKPTWSIRVGSLPMDGWYAVRVKGLGAPLPGSYDLSVEVNYPTEHAARNRADGVADITGGVLPRWGANLTLPVETVAVWTPSDLTPTLEELEGHRYSLTVYDANGTLAYASGIRAGAATFSAPFPGRYTAFLFAEPTTGGIPFSPIVRAFTFPVGVGNATVASTFAMEDTFEAPPSLAPTLLGYQRLPDVPGGGAPTVSGGEVVEGYVVVAAANPGPRTAAVPAVAEVAYDAPVTLVDPESGTGAAGTGLVVPGLAIGLGLAAIGVGAVATAVLRRR